MVVCLYPLCFYVYIMVLHRYFIKTPWIVKKWFSSYVWNMPRDEKTIYLNQNLINKSNGAFSDNLERVFIHEIAHAMGWNEFIAYSVNYSLNQFSREEIARIHFRTENKVDAFLEGTGLKKEEYFMFTDGWEATQTHGNGSMMLKPDKEEEFFKAMNDLGKSVRGVKDEDSD